MNLNELIEAVSNGTGMAPEPVKKVLEAAISTLSKQLQTDEPIRLQGLGLFKRRPGKEGKGPRIVFRPWDETARKRAKKAKKKEKAAKKAAMGQKE